MPTWFIFAFLSIFVLAGSEISQKISMTQKANISAVTNNFFVWMIQGTFGLILAIISGQFILQLDTSSIAKLILIGVVYFIGGTSFYTSYKGNSASISLILVSISVIVSNALGSIFFNEGFTLLKIAGILLILSAIVVINFNKKEKFNRYNLLAILGGVCFGFAYTIDKSFILDIPPFMYLALMCYSVAIVSIIMSAKTIVRETKVLIAKNFRPMISSGTFGSMFNLFTFFAYKNGGQVGIVDVMNNSSIFIIILIEIFFFKDRTLLKKKLFCALLAISGIVLLGLNK